MAVFEDVEYATVCASSQKTAQIVIIIPESPAVRVIVTDGLAWVRDAPK